MEWDGVVSLGYKKTYAVAKSMILTILADSIGIGIQNYRVFFINRTMDLSKMYLDSTIQKNQKDIEKRRRFISVVQTPGKRPGKKQYENLAIQGKVEVHFKNLNERICGTDKDVFFDQSGRNRPWSVTEYNGNNYEYMEDCVFFPFTTNEKIRVQTHESTFVTDHFKYDNPFVAPLDLQNDNLVTITNLRACSLGQYLNTSLLELKVTRQNKDRSQPTEYLSRGHVFLEEDDFLLYNGLAMMKQPKLKDDFTEKYHKLITFDRKIFNKTLEMLANKVISASLVRKIVSDQAKNFSGSSDMLGFLSKKKNTYAITLAQTMYSEVCNTITIQFKSGTFNLDKVTVHKVLEKKRNCAWFLEAIMNGLERIGEKQVIICTKFREKLHDFGLKLFGKKKKMMQ